MDSNQIAREFFDRYAHALTSRDPETIAAHYAVPALIEFPEQAVAVSDSDQTVEFFAAAVGQYAEVTEVSSRVRVVAEAPHSVWADVTWAYQGAAGERFVYQLILSAGEWRIAVLTPLPLDAA